uniref:Protein-glutamine gamma-glutamyltransferase 2 n=1 Tax=Pundamilia nyererei TaxID=303518 RepID=A0A3B4FYI7_9CICH
EHHTKKLSKDQLIVRRGQPFTVKVELTQPFNPDLYPLTITAETGKHPSENLGTKSCFGIPDKISRSPSAKAVWKVELEKRSYPLTGSLNLTITPPADAPIGKYNLTARYRNEETLLATLVVLFNPWCPDDSVSLSDEAQRQEYVLNEHGIIYSGSENYIRSVPWDFGQFEEDMVKICLKILDVNPKHLANAANDVSARCNPIYVSRVVSAMINSNDDYGVVEGRWSGPYSGGNEPTHWSGSYPILKHWYDINCQSVKYGQCWVFAGVMCSVMRLLGIPCRVITNFQSAHDNNKNLTIDVYHADYGVREKETKDSVWNFHVWLECWMTRTDLAKDGKYDGWQVVDPTPQEKSDGVYCCGPAPVKAILDGETDLKYDVPFVFAEVNADCIDWLVTDGTMMKMLSDTKSVGQNISTKTVGSNTRLDITDKYKYKEGEELYLIPLFVMLQVSKPMDGQDVSLKLVLNSESSTARPVSINISVQAMRYNGSPVENIQSEVKEETLVFCGVGDIRVVVSNFWLRKILHMQNLASVNQSTTAEVVFMNPVNKTLTDCTLTISGSGLVDGEQNCILPDLKPSHRFRVTFFLLPKKTGKKTVLADFDCSSFRDLKCTCTVNVQP